MDVAARSRHVSVGQAELIEDINERWVDVSGVRTPYIITADKRERIVVLLNEQLAVKTGVVFGE